MFAGSEAGMTGDVTDAAGGLASFLDIPGRGSTLPPLVKAQIEMGKFLNVQMFEQLTMVSFRLVNIEVRRGWPEYINGHVSVIDAVSITVHNEPSIDKTMAQYKNVGHIQSLNVLMCEWSGICTNACTLHLQELTQQLTASELAVALAHFHVAMDDLMERNKVYLMDDPLQDHYTAVAGQQYTELT